MDSLVAHQRAQDVFASVLANVGPQQLGDPTPCSEWAIRDLIEHVVGGNERVAQWSGVYHQPPVRPTNLVDAHRAAAAAAHEAFARAGGMDFVFDLPFGKVPGCVFIGMRTSDVLAHAWDLAAATGQSTDLDPELVAEELPVVRERVRPEFRGPGRPFGEEQPCPSGRPPADQFAALLGRKVKL